jgi:hypothetical protein
VPGSQIGNEDWQVAATCLKAWTLAESELLFFRDDCSSTCIGDDGKAIT